MQSTVKGPKPAWSTVKTPKRAGQSFDLVVTAVTIGPSPALVLQATNAGVRRPGYEARLNLHYMLDGAAVTADVAMPCHVCT